MNDELDGLSFLKELGPFFQLSWVAGEPDARGWREGSHADDASVSSEQPDGWRSLSDDLADEAVVGSWCANMAAYFAGGLGVSPDEVNPFAVRSALHLGLCARLISPWLGLMAHGVTAPAPQWNQLWWQPDGTTRFPLAASSTNARPVEPGDLAALMSNLNDCGLVTSPHVAWGNSASALNGACTTIRALAPDDADRARSCAEQALTTSPLKTYTGELGTPSFRRRSCCQLYALTDQTRDATCGDCILGMSVS